MRRRKSVLLLYRQRKGRIWYYLSLADVRRQWAFHKWREMLERYGIADRSGVWIPEDLLVWQRYVEFVRLDIHRLDEVRDGAWLLRL
jgi:hypothetical protein